MASFSRFLLLSIVTCVTSSTIPMVVHRTFIYSDSLADADIDEFSLYFESFARHNKDFGTKIWFKKDIMKLMNEEEMALYESLQLDIQRADMARYLILYHEGGYYADLDIYSFESWSKLVNR